MSDGRSFIKPDALSYSERLAELERKLPIFVERLQQYDKFFDQIKDMQASIAFLGKSHDRLLENIDDLKKEQQQQNNALTAKHSTLCQLLEGIMSANSKAKIELDSKHKTLEENQVIHMRYIDSLKKSASEIDLKKVSKDELDQFRKDVNAFNSASAERIRALVDKLVKFQDEISPISTRLQDMHNVFSTGILSANQLINELKDNQTENRFTIKTMNETLIPMIKNHVSDAFDKVKKLIPEIPINLDSIKKDIQDQMQRIELDGKNAVLRSVNNEKLVEMMKKQIENIYLLLKKHELSQ